MELKQQLKLSQQLIMTPQLQQAIKLLQLSRLELSDVIRQEIDENPVLDEALEGDANPADATETADESPEAAGEGPETATDEQPAGEEEFNWQDYIDQNPRPSAGAYAADQSDREDFFPGLTRQTTFEEHLLWQLRMQTMDEAGLVVGEYIIGNLDNDGYLMTNPQEITATTGYDLETVEGVREKIKKFDPVGVASLTLQECLLSQCDILPGENPLVKRIVRDCMKDLERKKYPLIAKNMRVSLKEVVEACELIAHMEPRPGRAYNTNTPNYITQDTNYITPDIYVHKIDNEFVVSLNENGQPKLKINNFYKNILAGNDIGADKAREFIQEKMRSAVWLIKSLYHRQSTIVNVMESIIKFQYDFFEYGEGHLKPLVLREVAEDISMHESNISRVTTNKYAHTPHGIFELKYFFNSGLASDNGESIASESVKNKIRDIIQNENAYKPLSDQDIANILTAEGIHIARRTVTKYREMLQVLSSSKRKKHI
jgi:RNA polymerase sigma-54 factor